jgi:hypothetical protein
LPYKTQLRSILLLFSPFPPPGDPQHRSTAAHLPLEILPNHTTPLRFRWPRASSPPPLVPWPDPVQLRPTPLPESPHPEPPLISAARARPRRRQPASSPLRPIQVWKSPPHVPLMLMRVLNPRVRRPFAGNGIAPPRPPHLSVAGRVPRLPVEHHPSQSLPWTL